MAHLLQIHEPSPALQAPETDCVIGIDLGTTHSVVATKQGGLVRILETPTGSSLVPSVVSYEGARPVVGESALQSPESVCSIKRLVGRSVRDISVHDDPVLWGLIDHACSQEAVRLRLGEQTKTVVEVLADILRYLKSLAQLHLGDSACKAVITVPAYFDEAARVTTRDAARVAGIEVLRLINEPTAAALAYGLDKGVEGLYAVYDLGGGTFDFSLLNLRQGIFQVIATGGDTHLGGDDFDHALAHYLLALHAQQTTASLSSPEILKPVLKQARQVKEALSEQRVCSVTLEIGENRSTHIVAREAFEDLLAPFVDRTIKVMTSVLHDAQKKPTDLQGVVLVGGSTRIPAISEAVGRFFCQKPLNDIHPDHAVAVGAAHQAHALMYGSETVLLDVTPLSLGIETAGGLVEKIIDRNTPIPVQKAQEFTTAKDGQTAMEIHVVQGERELVKDCRSLGSFTLSHIPPMVAGAARVQVTFTLDADGLLIVSAQEKTTGQSARIHVKPSYGLDTQEINAMLFDAYLQGQDDIEKRLIIESRTDAQQLLYTVEQALVQDNSLLSNEENHAINETLQMLRDALASCDRDFIATKRQALEKACASFAEKRMNKAIQDALAGKAAASLGELK